MPYSYRDDLTSADAAFDAWGKVPEELIRASVDATVQLMVGDLQSLRPVEHRSVRLEAPEQDPSQALGHLLHDLLQRIIYFKDVDALLLRLERVRLTEDPWALEAELVGEQIDPDRHELGTDVKAVTYHRYKVERGPRGWVATVVLDI